MDLRKEEELEQKLENGMFEMMFDEDVLSLTESDRKSYLESEEAAMLEARKMIGRRTRVSLSKKDDLTRRTAIGCIILAKEKNDPLYQQYTKYRAKEKLMKQKMIEKYSRKAQRIAKKSQTSYLKNAPILGRLTNR